MLASIAFLAAAAVQSDLPNLLVTKSKLSCRDWADVANYYIDMGADSAITALVSTSRPPKGMDKANRRVALLCRILFQGKKGRLREPALGALSLPYLTMPTSSWPEYPLAQENGVWFVLDENYKLGGQAEPASAYIDYCQKNGTFRTTKLTVPTRTEAEDAYKSLVNSKRWKAIRWSDAGRGIDYTYDRTWTEEMLRSQTHFSDNG